jgi:hypothetical protein
MKKGIRTRKIKRKIHNTTLITITIISLICIVLMPILFAFVDGRKLYGVIWFLSVIWCAGFMKANEKGCEDVY